MGNKNTDVSEFPNKRLENFFKLQNSDNIIPVVIHEYIHTQQKIEGKTLLGQSIYEGVCDFITELVLKEPGTSSKTMGDLGYFMGYAICRSYDRHANNKSKAIKDIIGLNYSERPAIMQFLLESKDY